MKHLKFIGTVILLSVLVYLIVAFALWDINFVTEIEQWKVETRVGVMFIALCVVLVSMLIRSYYHSSMSRVETKDVRHELKNLAATYHERSLFRIDKVESKVKELENEVHLLKMRL